MTSKVYITPEGAECLREELKQLWQKTRPVVTQQVSAAAALGDRSENADYIYGKKRLREIDRRIHYLTKRLDELTIVDRLPADRETVYFGAWVKVEVESGQTQTVRIVGSDESDPDIGWVSIDSPMARCLLGKKKQAQAKLQAPTGSQGLRILDISYTAFAD